MLFFVQLLTILIVLWIIWWIRNKKKYAQFPPGPPHLPILGSLLSIPLNPCGSQAFLELSKKYGDIMHVKLGVLDAIAFNSYDTVKEILCHDKATGRKQDALPMLRVRQGGKNLGLILSSGETWKIHRNFTVRTLRNFGFEKSSMDFVINHELDKLFDKINSQMKANPQGGIQAETMFSQTMVHVLWTLVTGIDYKLEDPKLIRLVNINMESFKSINYSFDLSASFPFLWDWFPNWFGKNNQLRMLHELKKFGQEAIAEHRNSGNYKNDKKCYIDVFLAKIEETRNDPTSEFNDEQLLICLLDLFAAGGETTSNTLSFSFLYMILYPEIQDKVWKEIDSKKREISGAITTDMKTSLPYTHATLLECFRFSTVVPLPPARLATEDFYLRGYLIKKGFPLLINIEAAHFSEKQWGDPNNFRPERFLKEDGSVDQNIARNLLSFGEGKRICFGQNLAESSSFIFFASILRSFNLTKVEGQPNPSSVPVPGITYSPQPFQLKFIARK